MEGSLNADISSARNLGWLMTCTKAKRRLGLLSLMTFAAAQTFAINNEQSSSPHGAIVFVLPSKTKTGHMGRFICDLTLLMYNVKTT